MADNRKISSYFQRSDSSQTPSVAGTKRTGSKDGQPSSSPLTSCPADFSSVRLASSPVQAPAQKQVLEDRSRNAVTQSTPVRQPGSFAASSSFVSVPGSQRVFKNGEIMITGSDDGDDDYSINSIALSTDDLLAKFMAAPSKVDAPESNSPASKRGRTSRGRLKRGLKVAPTKPKFSLDDLVADATMDQEREAQVLAAKDLLHQTNVQSKGKGKCKHGTDSNDLFASLVSDTSDVASIRRIRDAVSRTDALHAGTRWTFFRATPPVVAPLDFPECLIQGGTWAAALREPASRDRAFFSGIVGEVLHKLPLPDEILLWIIQSVATEPRDELRYAYTSALITYPAPLVSPVLQPFHIDELFTNLGAKASALAVSEPIQSEILDNEELEAALDTKYLLSALTLFASLAKKLSAHTREHILKLLFRLTLDEVVMSDVAVITETQRAINLLFSADQDSDQPGAYKLAVHLYEAVQETKLRSLLLTHITPLSPELALFRCRLATAYLFNDTSALDRPKSQLIDLKRISSHIKSKRFNVGRFRPAKDEVMFDFVELVAQATILDIAIDSGTLEPSFRAKENEIEFNDQVDLVADGLKEAFTAIQDSGASHMKRTEAKEKLQAIYYRLIHTVRTEPKAKKSWFLPSGKPERNGEGKRDILDKFLGVK